MVKTIVIRCAAAIFCLAIFGFFSEAGLATVGNTQILNRTKPLTITVQVENVYLDGDVNIEKYKETIWAMEDFWAEYEGYSLAEQREGFVIFRKQIDDISPLSKLNGYIGLTGDGIISTFHGRPDSVKIPIQLFFQVDTGRLESHIENKLKMGIPFRSKKEFLQVMNQYKLYAS
ncbi:intercompartmental signaling factor BofC [Bacillus gobiensis]|uniref:BofC C-terminal domain-containing protein n=1 Tax=Bacillus gobiensis TaxID=1441095 RepID=UPI003D1BC996